MQYYNPHNSTSKHLEVFFVTQNTEPQEIQHSRRAAHFSVLSDDFDETVKGHLPLLNIIVIKEHVILAREAWQLEVRKCQQNVLLELLKCSIVTRHLPTKISSILVWPARSTPNNILERRTQV